MTTSVDNIQWFHKHVSSTYHLVETAVPMADVAIYTIKYIKRLTLTQVSNKVKSDFFRMLINYIKAQGNLVAFFIEPITTRLLELIDDDGFNQDAFLAYHLSMPNPQSSPSSELIQQKNTPLASNKSEVRMKPRLKQLQIFNDGSSKKSIPGQTTSHDEGVHSGMLGTAIMNSPRIGPENLAVSFAAEEEFEEKKIVQAVPGPVMKVFTCPQTLTRLSTKISSTSYASSIPFKKHGPRAILPSIIGN